MCKDRMVRESTDRAEDKINRGRRPRSERSEKLRTQKGRATREISVHRLPTAAGGAARASVITSARAPADLASGYAGWRLSSGALQRCLTEGKLHPLFMSS